ncbi:MAG: PAC2 family protein [Candidatus Woesearchaeota archaeon]
MSWRFESVAKAPILKRPILIEGLPGIGNVGKIAADFIVEKISAKKIYVISSYTLPHSVFVKEDNLIEMPCIEVYYKKYGDPKRNDLLFLTGDVQPIDEVSCYEFCDNILDMFERFNGSEVVTLGGIGLQNVPKTPRVYCTGNSKDIVQKYIEGTDATNRIYGVVGPIVGVSGLLLGLAKKRDIKAVSLLAETVGHPMYLGIKGAREILRVLNLKLNLDIDLAEMDKEIKGIESEIIKRTKELNQISKETALKKIEGKFGKDVVYIG